MQQSEQLLQAYDAGDQIAPLSDSAPLTLNRAFEISGEIFASRQARGESVVGRKIGFTNKTIWEQYGVDAPMWSWIYDTTYHGLSSDGVIKLPIQAEPRLEPEIAFCFGRSPEPGMSIAQIFQCIDWVAHSIEIVSSPYPNWKFTIADCIAAQALHAGFWCGEKIPANRVSVEELETFSCALTGPNEVREGHATHVLGGPLYSVQFLLNEIERMPGAQHIQPGEVITTGTLTDGHPITAGETWRSVLTGIDLPAVQVHITT